MSSLLTAVRACPIVHASATCKWYLSNLGARQLLTESHYKCCCGTMCSASFIACFQVKKWAAANAPSAVKPQMDNYVVSRYIENPLLVGGKKFDLRVYVVVLNYRPLKVCDTLQSAFLLY